MYLQKSYISYKLIFIALFSSPLKVALYSIFDRA